MTKGVRWLIGGLSSGLVLLVGLFFLVFGGFWTVLGTASEAFDGRTVTGTVTRTNVAPPADAPGRTSTAGGGIGSHYDSDDYSGASGVTVRYLPVDRHGSTLTEVTSWAPWTGVGPPHVGDQVPVSYLYLDPGSPTGAGGNTDPGAPGELGRGFQEGGRMMFGIAIGLVLLSILGFLGTGIWASKAPPAPPRPAVAAWPAPAAPYPGQPYPGQGFPPQAYPGQAYPGQGPPGQPGVGQGPPGQPGVGQGHNRPPQANPGQGGPASF